MAEGTELTPSEYIQHHLTFLAKPVHEGGFWTLNVDSLLTSLVLGAIGVGFIAWVVRGNADPLEWVDRYGKRITAVHVKDIAPKGENADEDGWADVGHGTIDWKKIMKALREKTPAKVFIMEHDKPSDVGRFARRSIEAANGF